MSLVRRPHPVLPWGHGEGTRVRRAVGSTWCPAVSASRCRAPMPRRMGGRRRSGCWTSASAWAAPAGSSRRSCRSRSCASRGAQPPPAEPWSSRTSAGAQVQALGMRCLSVCAGTCVFLPACCVSECLQPCSGRGRVEPWRGTGLQDRASTDAPGKGRGPVLRRSGVQPVLMAHAHRGRRIAPRQATIVAAGVWSGQLLAAATGQPAWQAALQPRRGHLLELQPPAGMPGVVRGLMELSYTSHYSSAGSHVAATSGGGAGGQSGTAAETSSLQRQAVDITFTATTSASGSLLVGGCGCGDGGVSQGRQHRGRTWAGRASPQRSTRGGTARRGAPQVACPRPSPPPRPCWCRQLQRVQRLVHGA